MTRVTFNDKLKIIDESGNEHKKRLRQERAELRQELNIILGFHRKTRSEITESEKVDWGTEEQAEALRKRTGEDIEKRIKEIDAELSKNSKSPTSKLSKLTARVFNLNRNGGENNNSTPTKTMAGQNRGNSQYDMAQNGQQFFSNDQNQPTRQFTPPGFPHQHVPTQQHMSSPQNIMDDLSADVEILPDPPAEYGSNTRKTFTGNGNEWGGAKRKTFEANSTVGNEFNEERMRNMEEEGRKDKEREQARQRNEWIREQREQYEIANREREERFKIQMNKMEEQASRMREEIKQMKERQSMIKNSLNDHQRNGQFMQQAQTQQTHDQRHDRGQNAFGNPTQTNNIGNGQRGNWYDLPTQRVEQQANDQSHSIMMQMLIQMGRLQEQMANTQMAHSQIANARYDNRNNRNLVNGARDTFVRKLRQMPNFSGESLQKLKDFIQIGDLFMEECMNETERDEFYFQIKYNLRGEAREILHYVENDWQEMRGALKERFAHLFDRDIINSKLENLHQDRKESLHQFADRARKTLMEKNSAYSNISEEQREDHNRTARRAFIKGIQEKKIRDRMTIRGASSLESAISSALEMENEARYDVPEKEKYCLRCNKSGHRERDCKRRERSNDLAGQLAKVLNLGNNNKTGRSGQYKNFREKRTFDRGGNNSESHNQNGNSDNRGNGNRGNGGNREKGKPNGQQQHVFVNEQESESSDNDDDTGNSSASSVTTESSEN